ncbi:FAD-dependent urate hydroxylase [Streptomyces hundungensis]|uniref:FAD-dependent urate hydroxylase n=1 Tax=Streptomyces hundungensis TaxID=1077946 RepID=A0A387HND1_9ACTN|nr:NAD(P)/FAD-dependent oxidoreductase [Streptomyces hundungensis]AYG82332.1 FAD-dependent urate hydroxylase [Streptomyces hundungensis]
MTGTPHVLIIGGGIGGLCLAQGLRKAGLGFAVYEREAARAPHDQRLRLGPHGARALYECLPPEAWEAFTAVGERGAGQLAYRTEQLGELLRLAGPPEDRPAQHASHLVDRDTLDEVLLTGLGEHLVLRGREFTHYEQAPDGTVTAHFANGSTAYGDLLVGADGAESRVRTQLLPHATHVDTQVLAVTGQLELTATREAELPAALTTGANTILSPRSDALFSAVWRSPRARGADRVVWTYAVKALACPDDVELFDGKALCALVAERLTDWHPALRRLVAESDPGTVRASRMRALEPVEPWPPGRITLLGDAAHAMTALGGTGADTSLRDARLLSSRLARRRDLVRAVGAYETEMRVYGFEAVARSLRDTRAATTESRLARTLLRGALRTAAHSGWLRRAMFKTAGE